ncbi:hypothetical protein BAY61_21480 [Prauserella marina]|uniref:Uncharacterized protein n=1 Tax=Prauserella marina TaxID=530584 RepID=A0A222VT71_9PSEU|nr:hypothetical protein [Prauserella marina]ASR37135.1 hypothetical protein BAY61_21480 [Prauserella marina]PWV72441.1 hypothetical protein DES30_11039 [Prauserella marina]SDD79985.1 hypothetical protein SAMN05421630_112199 [Prauserella marina]
MTTTAPRPEAAATEAEQRQLKEFFEGTRTLPQLLATLRSRRVAMGYRMESGTEETSRGGRRLFQPRGPLAFVSEHPVVPLSEVEEAIVAWAACGPNGMAHWDIASSGGFHELVRIAGRTAAGPGNSFAHDLLVVKDEGAFIYDPGTERERMVEIEGEKDYHKVLDWYRTGLRKVHDGRPDIDWALRAPGAPNASLFGPYQYNINREGTTWFVPVTDVGWLYFSALLNIFDAWHVYLVDDRTGLPAGTSKWVGEGKLEFPITISQFEQFIFQVETYPPGSMVQNMRLAAEALGLGNWIFCGFFDDVLMGAFPDVTPGLGFVHEPLNERAPAASGALKTFGVPGVKEATYVPSPAYPDGTAVVAAMLEQKYGDGATMSRGEDNWMLRHHGPYTEQTVRALVESPAVRISDWAAEACAACFDYCVEHYGQAPVYFNPMQCNFGAVVHHVDPAFYEKYYDGSSVTPQIKSHFREWH